MTPKIQISSEFSTLEVLFVAWVYGRYSKKWERLRGGCLMFPAMVYFTGNNLMETAAVTAASAIIFSTHLSNFKMARKKEDVVNTQQFMEKVFGKK